MPRQRLPDLGYAKWLTKWPLLLPHVQHYRVPKESASAVSTELPPIMGMAIWRNIVSQRVVKTHVTYDI